MANAARLGIALAGSITLGVTLLPIAAHAQDPTKDTGPTAAPSKAPTPAHAEKPFEFGFNGSMLGAYDSNVFDKGTSSVPAGGADLTLGASIGVPLSQRVGWASGVGYGTNYRDGLGGNVGAGNTLRVDASAHTGIEVLLLGKTSLPGRHVKRASYPALKFGLEAKYALWSNPLTSQPKKQTDESVDALEPAAADAEAPAGEASAPAEHGASNDEGGGGGGEGAEEGDGAEAASIQTGSQTFSNPNTHHKVSGTARLMLEASKAFSAGLHVGSGRDIVNLADGAEVSPEYNDLLSGATATYKLSPKYLWLSGGYSFERRIYDGPNASGAPQDFDVHGGKLGFDVPLKLVKFKVGYDLRFKFADSGPAANNTRHQVQIGAEVPITKMFAAVLEARYTDTVVSGSADSIRFLGMSGLKVKM